MKVTTSNNIIVYIKPKERIQAFILFLGFLCMRPMLFGEMMSKVGMVVLSGLIVYEILKNKGKIQKGEFVYNKTYVVSILLFLYCLIQSFVLKSDNRIVALRICISNIICITAFYLMLQKKKVQIAFIRLLYTVMSFFVFSYAISLMLVLLGFDWNSIKIAELDYSYIIDLPFFFPLTNGYGYLQLGSLRLWRLLGFARECGIMQLFYIWGYFMADKYFVKAKLVRLIMVAGILFCLSTTGYIVFAAALIINLDIKKVLSLRMLVAVMLVASMVYLLFFSSGLRIADRSSITISERTMSMGYGLRMLGEHLLFGYGFMSTNNSMVQTGICAIASAGQIGLVGIALWLGIYASVLTEKVSWYRYVCAIAAVIATALFTQPLLHSVATYCFVFFNYSSTNYIIKNKGVRFYIGNRNRSIA